MTWPSGQHESEIQQGSRLALIGCATSAACKNQRWVREEGPYVRARARSSHRSDCVSETHEAAGDLPEACPARSGGGETPPKARPAFAVRPLDDGSS